MMIKHKLAKRPQIGSLKPDMELSRSISYSVGIERAQKFRKKVLQSERNTQL